MGKLILYGMDLSPPVRACLLTLKSLGLPFEYRQLNLLAGETHTKEFQEKNPQHTVPTLEDDGHFLWDSHAIMAYLVGKYAKDDALYPKDLLQRAVVDQRMHFDSGVAFPSLHNITYNLVFHHETNVPQQKIDAIRRTFDFLETFLKDRSFMAGDHLTIADFSLIAVVTSLVAYVEIDAVKYAKLRAWMQRMEQLPYYEEANGKGAQALVAIIKSTNFVVVP